TRTSKEHLIAQADLEIDNLRAAFTWSRENSEVASALELATSLQPLWVVRGRVAEGAAWLDAALVGLRDIGAQVAPPIRAKALADSGMVGLWAAVITRAVAQVN